MVLPGTFVQFYSDVEQNNTRHIELWEERNSNQLNLRTELVLRKFLTIWESGIIEEECRPLGTVERA